jgi:hypothetical protein
MTTQGAARRLYKHVRYQIRRSTLPLRRGGFSTFGEEALIKRYLGELTMGGVPGVAVDIGAADGRVGSNTLALFLAGWRGLAVELDPRKAYKLARLYQNCPRSTPAVCA